MITKMLKKKKTEKKLMKLISQEKIKLKGEGGNGEIGKKLERGEIKYFLLIYV